MTTICCISDCHLGFMHRRKEQRQTDYENAFKDALKKANELKPEIIIFGGDLFEHPKPDAGSLKVTITTLMSLAGSAKIVMCVGNHEIDGNISAAYPPLFSDLHENIHVLTSDNPHIELVAGGKKIGVHGFHYMRSREAAEETLKKLSCEVSSTKCDLNILCLHQGVEGYLNHSFELSHKALKDASYNYDLILIGHVHKHQRINLPMPAYYIGSTEHRNFDESENKTGFLAFMDFDFANPRFIDVECAPMKRIKQDMGKRTPQEINASVRELIEQNTGVRCLQISVDVDVEGDYFDIISDWEAKYPGFTILKCEINRRMKEDVINLEKTRLDCGVIDEYFEKSGLAARKDLRGLCLAAYEKYSGN